MWNRPVIIATKTNLPSILKSILTLVFFLALVLGGVQGGDARGAAQVHSGSSVAPGIVAPTNLQVTFINVWQGDAALLQDSAGRTMLVDGGLRQAGPLVVNYLLEHGITTIDVMVISHADIDHIGGLVSVIQSPEITTLKIVYNGLAGSSADWTDLISAAAARGLTPEVVRYPDNFSVGEMQVQALNPAPGQTSADIDDTSLVLRVDHGQVHFLFTGDIGSAGESAVMGRPLSPSAQVLKVAHHGNNSGSSSAFLDKVQPDDSIISTSAYLPPTDETLKRLANAGSSVWRTDQQGTIVVTSNGTSYSISAEVAFRIVLPVVMR